MKKNKPKNAMDDALLTGWVNKAYVEACEWK